ncbi:hypothetical protein BGZ73_006008 [Actinomortierella ambigua]|nr:hypothetical protein BGZ73_006008 [Actinomortierella ambigua]
MSKELKASYGFEKCKTLQDKINLLGLYQGLIKILECDINDIDRAFNENKLPELIVTTFYHKTHADIKLFPIRANLQNPLCPEASRIHFQYPL